MIAPWRVTLFGGLRLERDGQTVTHFRSQKTAALFAFLCLKPGRAWGREELCEIFWPETEPDAARNSLRVALTSLRKILEPPPSPSGAVLETTPTHIRLRPEAVRTDVAAFEATVKAGNTARARTLYAGPLLPGFYEEGTVQEAGRLALIREQLGDDNTATSAPQSPGPSSETVVVPTYGIPHAASGLILAADNLPFPMGRFFGRDEDVNHLEMWLADPTAHLVTVTGAGGTGKTRFVVEAARQLLREKPRQGRFPGGVWFLPLAPVRDAARIPGILRDALGIAPSSSDDVLDKIIQHLDGRPTLVILDNLEQVGAAELTAVLSELIARLPRVLWLGTSRRRIGLRGERVLRLSPLAPPAQGDTLEAIARNPAASLFVDRAREADVDFSLTARNAADVAAVCTLLDGVPLALELAAAWANVFTIKQICQELHVRAGQFEVRRPEDREERHRSLYHAARWSYDLLPLPAQQLFSRTAMFSGGFTLDAASDVADLRDTADALARLVEQSLIVPSPQPDPSGARRFNVLEPLREFALEQLTPEDAAKYAARHTQWIIARVETAPDAAQWAVIDADINNVRAALRRALATPNDDITASERAARLCGAVWQFWWNRGLWDEGIAALQQTCARDDPRLPTAARVMLWRAHGAFYFYRNQYDQAAECWEKQLSVALAGEEILLAARVRVNLAMIASARNQFAQARLQCTEAIALYESIGADAASRAAAFNNLGTNCFLMDDLPASEHAFTMALALFREMGDSGKHGAVPALTGIGAIRERVGDYIGAYNTFAEATRLSRESEMTMRLADSLLHLCSACTILERDDALEEAARHLAEAINLRRTLQNHEGIGRTLETAAVLLQKRGDTSDAAKIWGAYRSLYKRHPTMQETPQQARVCQEACSTLCTLLGDKRFQTLHHEGTAWDTSKALDFVEARLQNPPG